MSLKFYKVTFTLKSVDVSVEAENEDEAVTLAEQRLCETIMDEAITNVDIEEVKIKETEDYD